MSELYNPGHEGLQGHWLRPADAKAVYDRADIDAPAIIAPEGDEAAGEAAKPYENIIIPPTSRQLQLNFEEYRSSVADLVSRWETEDFRRVSGMPEFVDFGAQACVFQLPEDPDLVVKLPVRNTYDPAEGSWSSVVQAREALAAGIGHAGLEQLVAYSDSPDMPAVITRYVPGVKYDKCDRDAITDEHFAELIHTFQTMNSLEVRPDYFAANFMYDPTQGFTILDYHQAFPGHTLKRKVTEFTSHYMLKCGPHDEIPAYAIRYRDLCGDILGASFADAINENWEKYRSINITPKELP